MFWTALFFAAAVEGTVVRAADGQAVAGAVVRAGDAEVSTDENGRFVLREHPRHVIVSAPGLGTAVAAVPPLRADLELPRISLAKAASLRVRLYRPAVALNAILEQGGVAIARKYAAADVDSIDFRDLGPGEYLLHLRGSGPLQRLAARITLAGGERRETEVRIRPFVVEGRARLGIVPLTHAKIELQHADLSWRADVPTGADGRFAVEAWQAGSYIATIRGAGLRSSASARVVLRAPKTVWPLDLPARSVTGTVIDGATGDAIAGANVALRTEAEESAITVNVATGADGSFAFDGVKEGAQRLTISAPGFLKSIVAAGEHPVEVKLDGGTRRRLRVLEPDGDPAAHAELLAVVDGDVRATARTDDDGWTIIAVPPGGVVYAIAESGSFRAVRPGDGETVVKLPRSASSLRIVTRTTRGERLGNIALMMSVDGQVVPPAVARVLERMQGLALRTDAQGEVVLRPIPAGTYELWPYRSEQEAASIVAAGPMAAPITVNVKTGDNAIVVDFAAR